MLVHRLIGHPARFGAYIVAPPRPTLSYDSIGDAMVDAPLIAFAHLTAQIAAGYPGIRDGQTLRDREGRAIGIEVASAIVARQPERNHTQSQRPPHYGVPGLMKGTAATALGHGRVPS